jgi:DnaK suppressor protein
MRYTGDFRLPRKEKKMPSPEIITTCEKALKQSIERLNKWLETHPERTVQDLKEEEEGNKISAKEIDRHNHNRVSEMLADDLAALERIEMGTFGICVDCRGEIPEDRLVCYPYVKRCVPCQSKKKNRR